MTSTRITPAQKLLVIYQALPDRTAERWVGVTRSLLSEAVENATGPVAKSIQSQVAQTLDQSLSLRLKTLNALLHELKPGAIPADFVPQSDELAPFQPVGGE